MSWICRSITGFLGVNSRRGVQRIKIATRKMQSLSATDTGPIAEKIVFPSSLLPEHGKIGAWTGSFDALSSLVVYEDRELLLLYKPPTILSQRENKRNQSSTNEPESVQTPSTNNADSEISSSTHDQSLLDLTRTYLSTFPRYSKARLLAQSQDNQTIESAQSRLADFQENDDHDNSDILKDYEVFAELPHRLDRPVSGLQLIAKSKRTLKSLNDALRARLIDKKYLCVVNGLITESGHCSDYLLQTTSEKTKVISNPYRNKKSGSGSAGAPAAAAAVLRKDVLQSNLSYSPLACSVYTYGNKTKHQTLLEVNLETGRKHQIRAQLSHRGWPIVGDKKYGAPQAFKERYIALHAYGISFDHPTKRQRMAFAVGPPRIWYRIFGGEITSEVEQAVKNYPETAKSSSSIRNAAGSKIQEKKSILKVASSSKKSGA